jgi:hypothetical protein
MGYKTITVLMALNGTNYNVLQVWNVKITSFKN